MDRLEQYLLKRYREYFKLTGNTLLLKSMQDWGKASDIDDRLRVDELMEEIKHMEKTLEDVRRDES